MIRFSAAYYIFLIIAIAAGINGAAVPIEPDYYITRRQEKMTEAELQLSLLKRDLPPCRPCKKRDAEFDILVEKDIDPAALEEAERSLTTPTTYKKGYVPAICKNPNINCMYLAKNVDYKKGGIDKPLGHWSLEDGTEIYAWHYWQSTILFTGPGGSSTTYPAHCTIYTCVKGKMYAHIYDEEKDIKGNGVAKNSAPSICECIYKLDTDQYFGLL